jgi:hypothetical protein
MSSHEEQLLTRAEVLEETGDLAQEIGEVLTNAASAGVDPRAVPNLTRAANAIEPGTAAGYSAGARGAQQDGAGFGSDADFLEALHETETAIRDRLRDVKTLQEQVMVALDAAEEDLAEARDELAAAQAMPVDDPCDGCHDAKEAAIAAAQARITDAERRIGLCEQTAEILDPLAQRLTAALEAIRQVPGDLGDTYELIYAFIAGGGKMPRYGRWVTGEPVAR